MTDEEIERRVDAGMKWLDENVPDWRPKIDTHSLNMGDCFACILGQLYGDYASCRSYHALGVRMYDAVTLDNRAALLGFYVRHEDREQGECLETAYARLQEVWLRKIKEMDGVQDPQPQHPGDPVLGREAPSP